MGIYENVALRKAIADMLGIMVTNVTEYNVFTQRHDNDKKWTDNDIRRYRGWMPSTLKNGMMTLCAPLYEHDWALLEFMPEGDYALLIERVGNEWRVGIMEGGWSDPLFSVTHKYAPTAAWNAYLQWNAFKKSLAAKAARDE